MTRKFFAGIAFGVSLSIFSLSGCGGGGTEATAPTVPVRVSLNSSLVNVSPSGTFDFDATVAGTANTSVTWNVVGGSPSGTVSADGIYTAPTLPGIYRVEAVSIADPSVKGIATVTVTTGINVTIVQQNIPLKTYDDFQFTANVTGTGNTEVQWSVSGAGAAGTITNQGLYTAPSTPGTYTISAKSTADLTKNFTTTIVVSNGLETKIKSPTTQLISVPTSTVKFNAKVVGSSSRALTFSADGGTIVAGAANTDGSIPATWTAPTTPGIYTITATSTSDPSKTSTQTVKVVSSAKAVFSIADRGEFTINLDSVGAPATAANFVSLVNDKFYDGIRFHRIETTLIQGGSPPSRTAALDSDEVRNGGPGYTIDLETTPTSHVRGVISMASVSGVPNSAGSQFFIMKADEPAYDGQYASFGTISSGLNVIDTVILGDTITSIVITE